MMAEASTDATEPKIRRFNSRTTALQVLEGQDLTDRTMLITGCNAGIGVETARALALKGAHVIMACRNLTAAEVVRQRILQEKKEARVDLLECDLGSLTSVKKAADEFIKNGWPLHVLILNAGVSMSSDRSTVDGFERTFGVNHLGHFYLTKLLLDRLRESAPSRVVVVSSASHGDAKLPKNKDTDFYVESLIPKTVEMGGMTGGYKLYAKSKLCNVLFAFALNRREMGKINANALHPGAMIATEIARDTGMMGRAVMFVAKAFAKNLEQGASTTVFCAAAPEMEGAGGRYLDSCWFAPLKEKLANSEELQDRLWEESEKLIAIFEESEK